MIKSPVSIIAQGSELVSSTNPLAVHETNPIDVSRLAQENTLADLRTVLQTASATLQAIDAALSSTIQVQVSNPTNTAGLALDTTLGQILQALLSTLKVDASASTVPVEVQAPVAVTSDEPLDVQGYVHVTGSVDTRPLTAADQVSIAGTVNANITNLPATQQVEGTVSLAGTSPVRVESSALPSGAARDATLQGIASTLSGTLKVQSHPVTVDGPVSVVADSSGPLNVSGSVGITGTVQTRALTSSDQVSIAGPVTASISNWPSAQPVTGTVNITGSPNVRVSESALPLGAATNATLQGIATQLTGTLKVDASNQTLTTEIEGPVSIVTEDPLEVHGSITVTNEVATRKLTAADTVTVANQQFDARVTNFPPVQSVVGSVTVPSGYMQVTRSALPDGAASEVAIHEVVNRLGGLLYVDASTKTVPVRIVGSDVGDIGSGGGGSTGPINTTGLATEDTLQGVRTNVLSAKTSTDAVKSSVDSFSSKFPALALDSTTSGLRVHIANPVLATDTTLLAKDATLTQLSNKLSIAADAGIKVHVENPLTVDTSALGKETTLQTVAKDSTAAAIKAAIEARIPSGLGKHEDALNVHMVNSPDINLDEITDGIHELRDSLLTEVNGPQAPSDVVQVGFRDEQNLLQAATVLPISEASEEGGIRQHAIATTLRTYGGWELGSSEYPMVVRISGSTGGEGGGEEDYTQPVSGSVTVESSSDAPVYVTGTISVDNLPAIQDARLTEPITGTVDVGNFPDTQEVHVTSTQEDPVFVSVVNLAGTQQVSGSVTVSNLPATQPISATSLPLPSGAATESTLGSLNAKTPALGQANMAGSTPVVLASNQSTLPVQVGNFPSTQPVSGTVAVSNFPATQPVSGSVTASISGTPAVTLTGTSNAVNATLVGTPAVTVGNFPATQPVSGSVTATISGTPAVTVGNFPSTQPVSGSVTASISGTPAVTLAGSTNAVNATLVGTPSVSASISGTPTVNLGTLGGAATAAKQPALGIAGTASADVISVQGVTGMTPIKVDVVSGGGSSGGATDATLTGGSARTKLTDGTNNANLKVSAAALATDPALPVTIHPNTVTLPVSLASTTITGSVATTLSGNPAVTATISGTPAVTISSGTVTANLGTIAGVATEATLSALSGKLTDGTARSKLTDGTNNASLKVSAAAVATDPALPVTISPSSAALPVTLPATAATDSMVQGVRDRLPLVLGKRPSTASLSVVIADDPSGGLSLLADRTPVLGQAAMTGSTPVVIASNQSNVPVAVQGSVPVTGTFWQATQPVSGTVGVSNFPATQAVSGTVSVGNFPSTQTVTVSGGISINNYPSTQAVSGTVSIGNSPAVTLASTTISSGSVTATFPNYAGLNYGRPSAATSAVAIAGANASRRQLILYNESTATAYLKFGAGATSTSYTVLMPPGSLYELAQPPYNGAVTAAWSAANGAMQVTEVYG